MPFADYEGEMARVYDAGRSLPADTVTSWMALAGRYLQPAIAPLLDIGAGTGRFSAALADTCGVPVLAVEPAAAMRSRLRTACQGSSVWVLGARAERLPVRDRALGGAWASQVLHHVDDLTACAHELRRVLRPGAPVLVRGLHFSAWPAWWSTYFPGAEPLITRLFPSFQQLAAGLAGAGLTLCAQHSVDQVVANSLTELWQRVRLRADSGLVQLPDEQFAAGLRQLRAAAAVEVDPQPVHEALDLAVFR